MSKVIKSDFLKKYPLCYFNDTFGEAVFNCLILHFLYHWIDLITHFTHEHTYIFTETCLVLLEIRRKQRFSIITLVRGIAGEHVIYITAAAMYIKETTHIISYTH